MALNQTEAHAVNQLLTWIGVDHYYGGIVTDEEAQKAAALLAGKAFDRLVAGISREDVEKGWPER